MLIIMVVFFLSTIGSMILITKVFSKTSLSTIKFCIYTYNLVFIIVFISFYLAKTLSWFSGNGQINSQYGKWLFDIIGTVFDIKLECKIIFTVLIIATIPIIITKLILGVLGYGRMPGVVLKSSIAAAVYVLKSYLVMCSTLSSLILSFYVFDIPHKENLFGINIFFMIFLLTILSMILIALVPAANIKFHKISVERSSSYLAATYLINLICALDDKLVRNDPPKTYIVNINEKSAIHLVERLFNK